MQKMTRVAFSPFFPGRRGAHRRVLSSWGACGLQGGLTDR